MLEVLAGRAGTIEGFSEQLLRDAARVAAVVHRLRVRRASVFGAGRLDCSPGRGGFTYRVRGGSIRPDGRGRVTELELEIKGRVTR